MHFQNKKLITMLNNFLKCLNNRNRNIVKFSIYPFLMARNSSLQVGHNLMDHVVKALMELMKDYRKYTGRLEQSTSQDFRI
jgi:hypothetical protein